LRAELVAFARRYNETWVVARHGYKTPARLREEQPCRKLELTLPSQPPYPWRLSTRSRLSQNRTALQTHVLSIVYQAKNEEGKLRYFT
jgi:hypothetical protein